MDNQQISAAYLECETLRKLRSFNDVPDTIMSSSDPDSVPAVPAEYRSYLGRCVDFTMKRFWTVFFGEQFGTTTSISKPRLFKLAMLMSQNLREAREWVARIDAGSDVFSLATFHNFVEPFFAADFVDELFREEMGHHAQNDGYDGDDCSEALYAIASKWSGQPLTDFSDFKWKDILAESDPSFDKNLIIAVKEMHRRHFVYGLLDIPEDFYVRANLEVSKRSDTIRAEVIYLAGDLCRSVASQRRAGKEKTTIPIDAELVARLEALWGPEPSLLGQLEVLYGSLELGDGQKEEKDDDSAAWNVQGTPFTEEPYEVEEEDSDEEQEWEEDYEGSEESEEEDDDANYRREEVPITAERSLLNEYLGQVDKRKIGAEILGMFDDIKASVARIEKRQKPSGLTALISKIMN